MNFICKVNELVSWNESISWGTLRNGKVEITGTDYIPDIPNKEKVEQDIFNILEIENPTEKAIK